MRRFNKKEHSKNFEATSPSLKPSNEPKHRDNFFAHMKGIPTRALNLRRWSPDFRFFPWF